MTITKNRYITSTRPKGPGREKEGISIIILSSAPGYRMRSYGPKCLLKDKYGVSLLENLRDIYQLYFPISEVILVSGFEADKIIKNKPQGVRLVENIRYEETNELEEARLGINNSLYDNVLLTFGDIYLNQAAIRDFSNKESAIIVDGQNSMLVDDVGVTVVDNYATIMSFAIEQPKWCKILFLTGKELKIFKTFVADRDNSQLYLFEAINHIMDKGGSIKVYRTQPSHQIVHIDSPKELEKIQK